MNKFYTILFYTLIASFIFFTGVNSYVKAVDISVEELQQLGAGSGTITRLPAMKNDTDGIHVIPRNSLGVIGSSTTDMVSGISTSTTFCLTGDTCITAWSAGSGTVTSVDMSVPTGLLISGNPITTSGTLALTLDSGYQMLTDVASSTWDGKQDTITVSATGLTLTGVDIDLTPNYIIPLSASTTNWNTFYDTPSNRISVGTGLSWASNTLNGHVPITISDTTTIDLSLTGQLLSADGLYTAGDFITLTGADFDVDTGAIASGATTVLATAGAIYDFVNTATSTAYTAGGTLLDLTTGTFFVHEGTLTDTKICTYEAGTGLVCTTDTTISGISLGSNLADLTATDSTLTFSGTYNGGTARTIGLNLANTNTFTGKQTFGDMEATNSTTTSLYVTGLTDTFLATDSNGQVVATTTPSGGSGTPGGADTQIQYNNGGAFGGASALVYDDGNNYVGIGTTSPAYPLDIWGDTVISNDNLWVQNRSSENAYVSLQDSTSGFGLLDGSYFGVTGNTMYLSNYETDGTISFNIFDPGNYPQMVIKNDGNVGIATTTPFAKLAVENTGAGNSFIVGDEANDSSPFVIDNAGNVGIGTASPDSLLHLANADNMTVLLESGTDGSGQFTDILTNTVDASDNRTIRIGGGGDVSATRGAHIQFHGNESATFPGDLRLLAGSTGDITMTGNVGIGASNPLSKLEIRDSGTDVVQTFYTTGLAATIPADSNFGQLDFYSDDASGQGAGNVASIQAYQSVSSGFARANLGFFTAQREDDANPVERMTIDSEGNVGIGTSTPNWLFSLNGATNGFAVDTSGDLVQGNVDYGVSRNLGIDLVGSDTAVAVATSTSANSATVTLNGMNVTDAVCTVDDKGVTGTTDVALVRRRAGADVYVFSTNITIGDEWFASDETINTSNDDILTGDRFFWEIKGVHSGTAPNGLDCNFIASN